MQTFPFSDLRISTIVFLVFCSCSLLNAQSAPFNNPSNCGINLNIPDSTCNTSNNFRINVSGESGTQLGTDVFLEEIRLIIAHTWIADLDVSLVSPSGVKVELSSDNGEAEDNYGDPSDVTCGSYLSFSASACNSIENITTPPFVGEYQAEGNLFDFNDGSNPNGQWILEICDDAGDDAGTLEFVELVFSPVVCLAPSDLEIVSADSTAVELNWRSSGNCSNTIIEYGTPGFTPGMNATANGGTVVVASCPPFNLSGLAAYTDYEIYIREICDNGNFSANSCPLSIRTGCAPPPISLAESFDNQVVCDNFCGRACDIQGIWQNASNDSFDWTIFTDATPSANTGPSSDVEEDGNYIYIETSGSACRDGNQAVLLSNCIQIDDKDVDSCHFSFNYHMFGISTNRLRLQISSDGGGNWIDVWEETGTQGDQWRKQYISLAEWDGQIVRFRFIGEGGTGATGDIALDNLVFYGSQDLGAPSNRFYADLDMDGYGDPNNFIESCSSNLPSGFVTNDLDCDDSSELINPDAAEIACNGIDENCNGIEDDFIIPAPNTTSTVVCSGEEARVTAEVPTDGFILWFASPDSLDVLAFDDGTGYVETIESNGDTIVRTVYAEAWQGLECQSLTRTPTTITVYPSPQLAIAAPPVICPGETLDLSQLTLIDQNNLDANISFHSDLPDSTNLLNSLVVAPENSTTYFIQASTEQSCTDIINFDVQVGGDAQVSIVPSDTLSICAGSVQPLEVLAVDTTIDYTYVWSTGEVGDSIAVQGSSTAGTIEMVTLTITDPRGCETRDSVWLRASTGIESARVVPTEVSTCGGSDGSILVEPLSGTPPFDYFWSGTSSGSAENEAGAFTIENLAQGTYRITVVDNSSLGCDIQLPFTLVNGPNAKVSLANTEIVTCKNGTDGAICLEIDGDAPQIIWSNGKTTACIDSLSAGNYSVTVTDGACETILSDIAITEAADIQIAAVLTPPSCHDTSNGSIELTTSGGTFPYTYFWQDSSLNTEDRMNLSAGDYQLTILDANNCEANYDIPLNAPDTLAIASATIQNMSCFDIENGVIAPNVTGGTAPYFYEWEDGSFEDNLSNISAGSYSLIVTDVNGCQATNSFEVLRPEPLALMIDSLKNPSCEGIEDGFIRVIASGGSSNYVYQWSDDRQENFIDNLAVGKYTLTLFDENGCRLVDSFELIAPPAIQLSSNITHPKCIGARDGAIDLTLNNTTAATFEWSNTENSEDIDRLTDGEYSVTITDANACTFDTTFILEAPQLLEVSITTRSPSCQGSRDGSILLDVVNANGLPPDYRWNDRVSTQDRINIPAGAYSATIKDRDGCTFETDTIFLNNPEPIIIELDQIVDLQCSDDKSGSVEVSVSGGLAPYQYEWSTRATSQDLYDVGVGSYKLAVLDNNGCAAESEFFEVSAPPPLKLDFRIQQNELCQIEGGQIDSLILDVSGGVPAYRYRWSNGERTRNLIDVAPGDYSVTVADRNRCRANIASIKVSPPSNGFAVNTQKTNVQCNGNSDGIIRASVQGGTAPFLYHLSSGTRLSREADSIRFENLKPGNYDLTITDDNGCTTVAKNLFLTQPRPLEVSLGQEGIQNIACFGDSTGGIALEARGGIAPYAFSWQNSLGESVSDSLNLENAKADAYIFQLTDANGCQTLPTSFTLREPSFPIQFGTPNVTNVRCFGENTGAIQLRVSGGVPPFQYDWNNGFANTRQLDSIPGGFYQLEITDDNGCVRQSDSILVVQADQAIQLLQEEVNNTRCHDTEDGRIAVEVGGGIAPYQLFWESSDPGNNYVNGDVEMVADLLPGNYVLTVLDSFTCTQQFNFEIIQPEQLEVVKSSTPSERNNNTGTASVLPSGGTLPYSYEWNIENAPDTNFLDQLGAGVYFVTVSDANDCQLTVAIEVKADVMDNTEDLEQLLQFELFPNPMSALLHVKLALEQAERLQIAIYNAQGQLLLQQAPRLIFQEQLSFDLSAFASGAYWLEVRLLDGERVRRRFLKF